MDGEAHDAGHGEEHSTARETLQRCFEAIEERTNHEIGFDCYHPDWDRAIREMLPVLHDPSFPVDTVATYGGKEHTLLSFAVYERLYELMDWLIEHGADVNFGAWDKGDDAVNSNAPLVLAAYYGESEAILSLLAAGARVQFGERHIIDATTYGTEYTRHISPEALHALVHTEGGPSHIDNAKNAYDYYTLWFAVLEDGTREQLAVLWPFQPLMNETSESPLDTPLASAIFYAKQNDVANDGGMLAEVVQRVCALPVLSPDFARVMAGCAEMDELNEDQAARLRARAARLEEGMQALHSTLNPEHPAFLDSRAATAEVLRLIGLPPTPSAETQ